MTNEAENKEVREPRDMTAPKVREKVIVKKAWLIMSNICDAGKFKIELEINGPDGTTREILHQNVEQSQGVVRHCYNLTWLISDSATQAAFEQQAARIKELEEWKETAYLEADEVVRLNKQLSSAQKMMEVMVEALGRVSSYFDCLDCEMQEGMVCEYHLEERMKTAKTALAQYEQYLKQQKGENNG